MYLRAPSKAKQQAGEGPALKNNQKMTKEQEIENAGRIAGMNEERRLSEAKICVWSNPNYYTWLQASCTDDGKHEKIETARFVYCPNCGGKIRREAVAL